MYLYRNKTYTITALTKNSLSNSNKNNIIYSLTTLSDYQYFAHKHIMPII